MIHLLEGEEVIAQVHRHWLALAAQAAVLAMFGVLPFILEGILYGFGGRWADALGHYASAIVLLEAAWLLVLWMAFAVAWTNHYLDVLIITNQRVLDIDQVGLFSRDVAELSMSNIEDIRVEVNGFIAHWFQFGTLELQTAAESKSFIIPNLEHAERARELISNAHAAFIAKK